MDVGGDVRAGWLLSMAFWSVFTHAAADDPGRSGPMEECAGMGRCESRRVDKTPGTEVGGCREGRGQTQASSAEQGSGQVRRLGGRAGGGREAKGQGRERGGLCTTTVGHLTGSADSFWADGCDAMRCVPTEQSSDARARGGSESASGAVLRARKEGRWRYGRDGVSKRRVLERPWSGRVERRVRGGAGTVVELGRANSGWHREPGGRR